MPISCFIEVVHRKDAKDAKIFMDVNALSRTVIGLAIEIHKELGPGLLESAYEEAMCYELDSKGLQYDRQKQIPVSYKGKNLDAGYRIDLLVENALVLELKSVSTILPVHEAQVLTYMKLGGWPIGLLLNFNVPVLKQGIRRLVMNLNE